MFEGGDYVDHDGDCYRLVWHFGKHGVAGVSEDSRC